MLPQPHQRRKRPHAGPRRENDLGFWVLEVGLSHADPVDLPGVDRRYVYTLKQLVDRCKGRGGRAAELAADAEKELQFVWDSIEVQEKYKYDGLWSGADFDAYRWLLASKILALQEMGQ